ncbi:serine hydrolase [Castellaniella sp.]|uniref:serine hydrolase n=1 Tax=Castellaniella sp. TaxID=1955812 RepID=UPI003C71D45C
MAVQHARAAFFAMAALAATLAWSPGASAQVANFHPCNAQPALPICQHGYGKRVAVQRWGAQPEALDPDAALRASLVTRNPAREIEKLTSTTILVEDMDTAEVLFARDPDVVRPIASITKLMTALVVLKAGQPLDEMIRIDASDDGVPSELPSRLAVGTSLSRSDLLHLALMSSENSAAHALGRAYPGGIRAFVDAMNAQAQALGMTDSRFVEPVGLSNENVSSASDLARLIKAAARQPLIRQFTTDPGDKVSGQVFHNTNMLVGRPDWAILASKTGTTREAGDCLIMVLELGGRQLAMVLLNAQGVSGARFGDAVRVRRVLSSRMAAK